jgi:ABC-type cobalamin/Fe3+-siderophores transport system ATPase subunit
MRDAILDVSGLTFRYGQRVALKDVSFTVSSRYVTMLLGPNGAGKTTLFSLITRLLPLQTGHISE